MKKIKECLAMLTATLLILSFTGCDDNLSECEESVTIDFVQLKSQGSTFSLKNIETNKEIKLVIDSQADYEKYVSSNNSLPEIDFDKNILISGKSILSTCGVLKNQTFLRNCNTLTYKVEIERLDCHKPEEIFHFAIIPKNLQSLNIVFETNIK